MSTKKILIVTEANERIASGHLFECIVCADYFQSHGLYTDLMVNKDMPFQLGQRIPNGYLTYQRNIQEEPDYLISCINRDLYQTVIFNLREINNGFLKNIKKKTNSCLICIDEFGNRRLDADIIINPMIDENYWNYDTDAKLYCGEQYLVLPLDLQEYHQKKKNIKKNIDTITISMGGVDCGNTTMKLAEWLPQIAGDINMNVVLGGGYLHRDMLETVIAGNDKVHIYQNISYLSRLFFESDLAICAGGNTLHELAVIGTPAIVVPSMPHEVKNGEAYQRKGFSLCGNNSFLFEKAELKELYETIKEEIVRRKMSYRGKMIADGKGFRRIYDIVSQIMI